MQYDLWAPKLRIELEYKNSLMEALKRLQRQIDIQNTPDEIMEVLWKFSRSIQFKKFLESVAQKMVTSLFTDAGKTWREAARVNTKGRTIYESLRRELEGPVGNEMFGQIIRNAQLIKTLPNDLAEYVNQHIYQETLKGRRASDIAKEIKEWFPAGSKAKAELIARTEVSKTHTALTEARCKNLGLNWYAWRSERDSRVRESHQLLESVLINWNDPPSPEELSKIKSTLGHYHAGNCPNCRCYPEPLTDLNLISWTHKVYYDGKIKMMTLAQFKSIM